MPLIGGAHRDNFPLDKTLDENGDGTGNRSAIGNYSLISPGIFFIQPPPNEIYVINTIIITILDNGTQNYNDYGSIGGGLSNGILVDISDDTGIVRDLTSGLPLINNFRLTVSSSEYRAVNYDGGIDAFQGIWNLNINQAPIKLYGDQGTRLNVTCRDNLSTLVGHQFTVLGYV